MAKDAFGRVADWLSNEPSPEAMQNAMQAGYNPETFYDELTINPYDSQHGYGRPDMPEGMSELSEIKGYLEKYKISLNHPDSTEATRTQAQEMIDRLEGDFNDRVNTMIENGQIGPAVEYSQANPPAELTWEQHQGGQSWQVAAPGQAI